MGEITGKLDPTDGLYPDGRPLNTEWPKPKKWGPRKAGGLK